MRARIGRDIGRETLARGVWIGVGILALDDDLGGGHARRGQPAPFAVLTSPPPAGRFDGMAARRSRPGLRVLDSRLTLPVVGGGEALARAAHEFPPPRVQALRRTGLLTVFFTLAVTTARHVPGRPARARRRAGALGERAAGRAGAAPGRARVGAGPDGARARGAPRCWSCCRRPAALGDAEQMLHRSSADGDAAARARLAAHALRHAGPRRRRDGGGDDHRHSRERRPRRLAGARVRRSPSPSCWCSRLRRSSGSGGRRRDRRRSRRR